MTTLNHQLPFTGSVPQVPRARGVLAAVAENAYLRLFSVLVVIAAGAVALAFGIAFVLDIVVPVFFGGELRALGALFPQVG
ncbi:MULTISPECIES: hypothetical protein [unclassified Leifsonia]|uniref:hypothetical protein n=1 Tax=unclassified Leifsonia TaxID=2663824 RepID=UPI000A1926C6|nr:MULTISPECIES: hypothetical protein [unclassified Leifsonia]QIZ97126.1 hypothetical protein HF024_00265 [Leifsonia sp. PS1209]